MQGTEGTAGDREKATTTPANCTITMIILYFREYKGWYAKQFAEAGLKGSSVCANSCCVVLSSSPECSQYRRGTSLLPHTVLTNA
jgi:hypothetical protein